MTLPSWVGRPRVKAAPAASQVAYRVADSVHTAPGWRLIEEDFYTCIPPVDMPFDKGVLRRIHSFDPGAIPIWRKQMYLPPDDVRPVVVTHFGIARHVRNPHSARLLVNVEMPLRPTHPTPNELEFILEETDLQVLQDGGPGRVIPIDNRLYRFCRAKFNETKSGAELGREWLERQKDRRAREIRRVKDALEARSRDFNAWAQKQLDKPGDTARGLREFIAKKRAQRGQRRPMVALGRG